jgi:hypothetical protein
LRHERDRINLSLRRAMGLKDKMPSRGHIRSEHDEGRR